VQRSSETIGTIAAALAKAQAQLVNPEKSLVATIRPDEAGGSERSFRYAPLSTGLDIVRKVDKSVLSLPAPRRIRDREHVKSVAKPSTLRRRARRALKAVQRRDPHCSAQKIIVSAHTPRRRRVVAIRADERPLLGRLRQAVRSPAAGRIGRRRT